MLASRQVRRWLYELYAFYAIFIGVTSYRYDFELRQGRSTIWTRIVATLANLAIVSVMFFDLFLCWFEVLEVNVVTVQTIQLYATVNDLICLVNVVQRLSRDRASREIVLKLRRLRRIYRYRWAEQDSQLERRLEHIFLAKNVVIWAFAAFYLGFMLMAYPCMGLLLWNGYLIQSLMVLYIVGIDSLDMTMHMHFLLNWRICRLYVRLNRRLGQLLRGNSLLVDTQELHHLRWQHAQLSALMQRLTSAYKLTMLSNRLSLIVTAASVGYLIKEFHIHSTIYKIVGFSYFAVLALDSYILDLITDWTVHCHRESSWLLAQHQQLPRADRQLSRACDLFSLQIACFPLQLKPCGLFECGRMTWLSNVACIIAWMVVLLQYRIVSK